MLGQGWRACNEKAIERGERDLAELVLVGGRSHLTPYPHRASEFFSDLPLQRRLLRFTGLDLAARKLPEPGQVSVVPTLRAHDATVPSDDCPNNVNLLRHSSPLGAFKLRG